MGEWRKYINPEIKEYLETQIRETTKHSSAYKNAKNPSSAQLWVAIANLSKQIFDLDLRLRSLEKTLRNIFSKKYVKKNKNLNKKLKSLSKKAKVLEKSLKRL